LCLLDLKAGTKAAWRKGKRGEDAEHFYRRIYNVKTGQFKMEIVTLCTEMNIEPENLKPKTLQDLKEQLARQKRTTGSMAVRLRAPGNVDLDDDALAETRLKHYNKRRQQALVILQVRLEDR